MNATTSIACPCSPTCGRTPCPFAHRRTKPANPGERIYLVHWKTSQFSQTHTPTDKVFETDHHRTPHDALQAYFELQRVGGVPLSADNRIIVGATLSDIVEDGACVVNMDWSDVRDATELHAEP